MNSRKTPSAFRLTTKGKSLLRLLAEKLGVNQTAVVEMAIRQMAEREKIVAAETPDNRKE